MQTPEISVFWKNLWALEALAEEANTMNEQMIFEKFPKIPRLNREIIITEKIDGTNAQVLVTEDGQVYPGSRNRWLTPQDDNFGFADWVFQHEDKLLRLGPGRHYGEWWGQGIQRKYGLDHRRFSLFNVQRWQSEHECPYRLFKYVRGEKIRIERTTLPACCHVVPILYAGMFDMGVIQQTAHRLKFDGSRAAPGFEKPEGIVIYHTAGNCMFKVVLEHDAQWKGSENGYC